MNTPENNTLLWLTLLSLSEQATRDWLTGLYNRRFFEETLTDHIAAAERYDRELSLVLFDLDRFKAINDTGGHDAGDRALIDFSAHLRSAARAADIPCRYGGDEFAIILPETGLENARQFAERIVKTSPLPVTAGIAALPDKQLIKAADEALQLKKRSSRQPPNR